MIPILSFIGKSNSGKTTFIEKLIPELNQKGFRVATVKHDRSHGFDFDKKGKDSWRHKEAGAEATILSSPRMIALIRDIKEEASLSEIAFRYAGDADLLIAEGFKDGNQKKIEITTDLNEEHLFCKKYQNVVAVISDNKLKLELPMFKRDSISEVAEWIEKKILTADKRDNLALFVNSKKISLKPFIANILTGTIKGIIFALKMRKKPVTIELKIVNKSAKK